MILLVFTRVSVADSFVFVSVEFRCLIFTSCARSCPSLVWYSRSDTIVFTQNVTDPSVYCMILSAKSILYASLNVRVEDVILY
jgi:hypothetical protein